MYQLRTFLLFLSGLACGMASPDCACAQGSAFPSTKSQQNIVVLNNGGVLRGRTVKERDATFVYPGGRSEIRLPPEAIDFVCESMQQAYEIQRDRNSADDPDAHIELAAWCVRHDLLEQAAAELNMLQDVARSDIRVRSLSQQVASRRRLQQAHAAAQPPAEAPPKVVELRPYSGDTQPPQVSTQSIGQFNTSVQSRLLNGCAASGCHGAKAGSSFQLACESPGRPATRRMTFENFAACFQLIDRANPEKSKLLSYASTPHANLDAPVYRQGSRHYEAIADWVKTAALSETDGISAGRPPANGGDVQLATAVEELRNHSQPDDLAHGETPQGRLPLVNVRHPDAAGQDRLGADPFDPEVFNRLYGAQPADPSDRSSLPSSNDPFGSEGAKPLQAPRRLSDAQKENALQIGALKN